MKRMMILGALAAYTEMNKKSDILRELELSQMPEYKPDPSWKSAKHRRAERQAAKRLKRRDEKRRQRSGGGE
jgi:hypothetical protein